MLHVKYSGMDCIICGRKSEKTYDNINLCEECYQTNIEQLNTYNANLNYEVPSYIIDNIYVGSQKSGVDMD